MAGSLLPGRWTAVLLATTALAAPRPVSAAGVPGWEGAWVVLSTEVYSDCADCFTSNRVTEGGVESLGARRFAPGEVARVRRLAIGRRRVEVRLKLAETVAVPVEAGPDIRHEERACSVELRIETPLGTIREGDREALEQLLGRVLERFPTPEAARAAPGWNGRRVEPSSAETRASAKERREWMAHRVDEALAQALDLLRRSFPWSAERVYAEDFAAGMRQIREGGVGSCETLASRVVEPPPGLPETRAVEQGRAFAFALGAIDRLSACAEAMAADEPERREIP